LLASNGNDPIVIHRSIPTIDCFAPRKGNPIFLSRILTAAYFNNSGSFSRGRKMHFANSYTPYHSPGMPEYYAYNKSVDFYLAGGAGYTRTFGYMKGEGFFEANTINFGGGLDAGVGGGLEIGQWNWAKASGLPKIESLNGLGGFTNYAFGPVNFGASANLDIYLNSNIADFSTNKIGNNWNVYSVGLSIGPYPVGGSGGLSYTYARKISFWKFIGHMF